MRSNEEVEDDQRLSPLKLSNSTQFNFPAKISIKPQELEKKEKDELEKELSETFMLMKGPKDG